MRSSPRERERRCTASGFLLCRTRLAIVGSLMNEEAVKERFEELEKMIDVHKQFFDALKADFEFLVGHSPIAQGSNFAAAAKEGIQHFDQAEAKRCREFVEKYGIQIG
jgi:hypothetical protein